MLLYNITYNVETEASETWLAWMQETLLPDVLATNLIVGHKQFRLLTELDNGGLTYSFQYFFADMDDYLAFQNNHSEAFDNKITQHFSGKYVSFKTLLEAL